MKRVHILKNKDNPKNAVSLMEDVFSEIISSEYFSSWSEHNITSELLSSLKNEIHGKSFSIPTGSFSIQWENYKQDNVPDDDPAVISFIVDITFHDSQNVKGIYLLNTKLREKEKHTFHGLKKDFTKKLSSLSNSSSLLLIDYDLAGGSAFSPSPESITGNDPHSWSRWSASTNCSVISCNAALALGSKTTSLYRTALPFTYEIFYRIFHGLDLDYSKGAIEAGLGKKPEKFMPSHITYINLSFDKSKSDSMILTDHDAAFIQY
jgi:hypothetical protein